MNIITENTLNSNKTALNLSKKPHFELHFHEDMYVLYEETNGQYHRAKYKDIYSCGNIKRIHYNTSKWKNYLIIDIDNENIYEYRNQKLPEPNFILKNKIGIGAHLFYVLENGIPENSSHFLKMWKESQKLYTVFAGGDKLNKGYVGKYVNSKHFEYVEINTFAYDINFLYAQISYRKNETQSNVSMKVEKPSKSIKSTNKHIKTVEVGERNSNIFDLTRKYAYIQIAICKTAEEFEEKISIYIVGLNNSLKEKLELSEISNTAKSIINYCHDNKSKIINYNKNENKNRGVLKMENINLPKKEKQKLGAEYSAKIKIEKTKLKIQLAIIDLKSQGKKITQKNISEITKLNKNTLTKYKDLLK